MEFAVELQDLDDARDLFTIAKERLLDVNEWNTLLEGSEWNVALCNAKAQKAHRNMRVDDLVCITDTQAGKDIRVRVRKIQYDIFPDIQSESFSVLLSAYDMSQPDDSLFETVFLKRENNAVTIHCNSGDELPLLDASTPNDQLNTSPDHHPLLHMPSQQLARLLSGFIAIYAYHSA